MAVVIDLGLWDPAALRAASTIGVDWSKVAKLRRRLIKRRVYTDEAAGYSVERIGNNRCVLRTLGVMALVPRNYLTVRTAALWIYLQRV